MIVVGKGAQIRKSRCDFSLGQSIRGDPQRRNLLGRERDSGTGVRRIGEEGLDDGLTKDCDSFAGQGARFDSGGAAIGVSRRRRKRS